MVYLRILIFIFLVPFIFSSLCLNKDFNYIAPNQENTFEVGPYEESCFKYSLSSTKKKIILVFPKTLSLTSEVLLYKSKSDISMAKDEYQNFLDRFLINENSFKEIDLSNYENEIYIIIRDGSYVEVYNNYFILYDPELPIALSEGVPLTIKYFVKNTEYKFEFSSNKNLTFVYSTKIKSKKYISITYNDQIILPKNIDRSDHKFNLKSENSTMKKLYVTVEDIEEGTEDQEFSVIVYEKNITQFFEIKEGTIYTTNYLSLNKDDETQIFFFYYNLGGYSKTNTINFKLDPENKISEYINIQSGVYHSVKEIPDDEKDAYFRFNENKFPIKYDINSEEYKKLYFQDSDTSFPHRCIYFKVEISKVKKYFSPQNFLITIGKYLEKSNTNIKYYKTQIIKETIKPLIPLHIKLILDPKEKYLLTSPLPSNTIFTKGDLIIKDENLNILQNQDNFMDPDNIIIISDISELTITLIYPEIFIANLYLEKIKKEEVYIIENYRNYEPFELVFDENECDDDQKKYLLGIYNKEIYSKYNKTYTKYWTSNDGDFNVYYRNNILPEKDSLFPLNDKYLQKKEYTIMLNFYIDFFTFTCNKPGTLSLRSPYKIFNETTHKVGQNSFLKFTISNKLEILQLTAPMKPPNNYLYFGIFSKYGKKIKISPDCPSLFQDTTIEGDQVFLQKIDLYKFESDQLAIKLTAEESTQLEAVEVIRYNFTEYTVIKNSVKRELSDNHFVKFLDYETKEIKVKINKLKDVEIVYGIVQLFTNDINYLPMAYQFKDDNIKRKTIKKKETLKIKNPFVNENDSRKKYLAFVFSIPSANYYEYEAQIIQDTQEDYDDDDEDDLSVLGIVIAVIGTIVLFVIIGIVIYYKIKNRKTTKDGDEIIDNEYDSNNNNVENTNYNSINSDNDSNNNNNNTNNNVSKTYRFDDEEDDKRLYKSFEDD